MIEHSKPFIWRGIFLYMYISYLVYIFESIINTHNDLYFIKNKEGKGNKEKCFKVQKSMLKKYCFYVFLVNL